MGTAVYYMKARWKTEEEAQEALAQVIDFLDRLREAYKAWQEKRKNYQAGHIERAKEMDQELRNDYKDVFDLLGIKEPDNNELKYLNYLSGFLSNPSNRTISQDGQEIWFHGEVWHFADWTYLGLAIKKLGAYMVGWISGEYSLGDPYDKINLDYTKIDTPKYL